MKLPESLTTVTKFSKILALALFILLPFFWFFIGFDIAYKVASYNNHQVSTNPTFSGMSQIERVITVLYYDNDLKMAVRNKFGILKDDNSRSFFFANNNLDQNSIKILHSIPIGGYLEYTNVREINRFVVASYYSGTSSDIVISDQRGVVIIDSFTKANPDYKDWLIANIRLVGGNTAALDLYNLEGDKAYVEVFLPTGKAVENSFLKLSRLDDPYPIKYYREQFDQPVTFNGYDYILVQRPSMNFPIDKSTEYTGVLKKTSGTDEWKDYIKIISTPDSSRNNPYKLWFENGLYLLIADQNGAGSGEGIGKLLKIEGNGYTLVNCFYYGNGITTSNSLKEIQSAVPHTNKADCNNFTLVFK